MARSLSPAYVLGHNAQPDLSWSNAKGSSTWGWATQLLDSTNLPPAQPGVRSRLSLPLITRER